MIDPLRIAFLGVSGGTGRTTLVAHVAKALHQSGQVPMAFDLDPQNTLGLHLGMKPGESFGFCREEVTLEAIPQMLRRNGARVPYLPFGAASDQELRHMEHRMAQDPEWLPQRMRGFMPRNCSIALIDASASTGPWRRAALEAADLVVMVARPDPGCFAALPHAERRLTEVLGPDELAARSVWVLSRFDACRSLDRDIRLAFHHALRRRLLPVAITECVSLGEALARNETVDLQGGTQVALELCALTEELKSRAEAAGPRTDAPWPAESPRRLRLTAITGGHDDWEQGTTSRGRYHVKR
ncbi:MAG: cellulose synthase operon protein YhjQ/BcsQ [Myxococcota bacterium]